MWFCKMTVLEYNLFDLYKAFDMMNLQKTAILQNADRIIINNASKIKV